MARAKKPSKAFVELLPPRERRARESARRGRAPSSTQNSALTASAVRRWRAMRPAHSRAELAVACGKSVSTIDRWERGLVEPTPSDIRALEALKPGLVALLFGPAGEARKAS